jgi:hypothetical protein
VGRNREPQLHDAPNRNWLGQDSPEPTHGDHKAAPVKITLFVITNGPSTRLLFKVRRSWKPAATSLNSLVRTAACHEHVGSLLLSSGRPGKRPPGKRKEGVLTAAFRV